MTHRQNDMQKRDESQATFAALLREKVQQAVRTALISVLEAEVDAFIGAVRYERSAQRQEAQPFFAANSSLPNGASHRVVDHGERANI